jgi:hypothetical protein
MRKTTRIELSDSLMDIAMKMGEGNPGALTVCALSAESMRLFPKISSMRPAPSTVWSNTHDL